MSIFIDGIGLAGYRSFGDIQRIGPFGKVNLFVGANNSGKSNILRFLYKHFEQVSKSKRAGNAKFEPTDLHHNFSDGITFELGFHRDAPEFESLCERFRLKRETADLFRQIVSSSTLTRETDCVWINRFPGASERNSELLIENCT